MKIEIWSDFVCPFCYIGKRNLEKALEQIDNRHSIEVEFKSFQLDPRAEKYPKASSYEIIAARYGIGLEESKAMHLRVAMQGAEVGPPMNFDKVVTTNTFDAHRLSHYAKAKGKMREVAEILMKAHFAVGENIGDIETLVKLGSGIGLDEAEVRKVLSCDDFASDVSEDINKAKKLGIDGVPYFLIDGKLAAFGAQPAETLLDMIKTNVNQ